MWTLLPILISLASRTVLSQDQNRLMLHGGKHSCEGYARIFMEDEWGVVGSDGWTDANERVACRSTGCGSSLGSSDVTLPASKVWLNDLNCTGTEAHLWDCPGAPGRGVGMYIKDTVKKITCSEKVVLQLKGFKCAGAVYYHKEQENTSTYFCDNWDRGHEFGHNLCMSLNCGGLEEKDDERMFTEPVLLPKYRVKTQCTSSKLETYPWQCNPTGDDKCDPAIIVCQGHNRYRIKGGNDRCSGSLVQLNGKSVNCSEEVDNLTCETMRCGAFISSACDDDGSMLLHCSDNITIFLEKGNFGEIQVVGPLGKLPVCASKERLENSKVVCKELGFGEVIDTSLRKRKTKGILDDVTCSGDEESLWDCKAKYSKAKPQECNQVISVTCEDSLDARLVDGPGRCAGRLEIKFSGEWYRVGNRWTAADSHVVCQELGCGMARTDQSLDTISPGSLPFLKKSFNCGAPYKRSSCKVESIVLGAAEKPTMLVCEGHLELFVKGGGWCEGQVGVRQHDDLFWLSGSNATWTRAAADLVCRQMHCGSARDHASIPLNASKIQGVDIWPKEYDCSSKETSLFECPESHQTNGSLMAFVRCAGKVTLGLKASCSGEVEVCVNNTCGGVCEDSWSDAKSREVCKSIDGCGEHIPRPGNLKSSSSMPVTVKSLHFHPLTGKSLVMNKMADEVCKGKATVLCSGSMKASMTSEDYCFGTVELDIAHQRYPICNNALSKLQVQDAICAELNCGTSGGLQESLPQSSNQVMSVDTLTCPQGSTSVANCSHTSKTKFCPRGRLRCSEWRRLILKGQEGACKGEVFLYSKGAPLLVSGQGWTQAEGDVLCRDLGCKAYRTHRDGNNDGLFFSGTFNCSGVTDPKNIWDCLQSSESAAGNKPKKPLHLTCQDHLKAIRLSGNCRGDVLLGGTRVVDNGWTTKDAHRVCKETSCGEAFADHVSGGEATNGSAVQVNCLGPEDQLGHCRASEVKYRQRTASVFCKNAFRFNTTEKCGGQVEVKYPDEGWQTLCLHGTLNDKVKEDLCAILKCGKPIIHVPKEPLTPKKEKPGLQIGLQCSRNHYRICYCVSMNKSCQGAKLAEIYCEGYPVDLRLPVGLATGVVVLLLAVGLFFLLRHRLLRGGISKRRDVEVETSDYDDVGSSVNGRRSLSRMDSSSPPAEVPWNDSESASLSYDDIAEGAPGETLPLVKEKAPEEESPDDSPKMCYSDVAPSSKAADNVSPGVDIQEDYDDVLQPEPKVAETYAEADGRLKAPHRELPEVPLDDMEGDDDYLEQDPLG